MTRPESVRKNIDKFANNGVVRRPLISVHGTLDALIPLKGHARPYKAMVEAKGYGQNYRLYEIQNGNHIDRFKGDKDKQQLPNLELIQPHAQRAFDLLEDWVERGTARHRVSVLSGEARSKTNLKRPNVRICLSRGEAAYSNEWRPSTLGDEKWFRLSLVAYSPLEYLGALGHHSRH